jgi:hypothetical protein
VVASRVTADVLAMGPSQKARIASSAPSSLPSSLSES